MGDETVDYEHLMSCRDPHCLYCTDEPRHVTAWEREQQAWDTASILWDVGALPVGHPFKQAA